jgi:enoyl-CoA hydratase/carnithine racemase
MDTAPYALLHVSQNGPVVSVRLDHGRANEMGRDAVAEWARLAQDLESGDATALITHSQRRSAKGTPIFISGANVTEREGWSTAEVRAHVAWQRATLAALRRAPVFHVAVVNGMALGWGTEFLLTADYRIATPEAVFALPETGLGILPGAGGTSELWSMIGPAQALRLGMTGERIDAAEAQRIGLVQEIRPDVDAALARAGELAALAARRSPTAIAAFKAALIAAIGQPGPAREALEARAYELCLDSGEAAIGRAHFKEITAGEAVAWGPRTRFQP